MVIMTNNIVYRCRTHLHIAELSHRKLVTMNFAKRYSFFSANVSNKRIWNCLQITEPLFAFSCSCSQTWWIHFCVCIIIVAIHKCLDQFQGQLTHGRQFYFIRRWSFNDVGGGAVFWLLWRLFSFYIVNNWCCVPSTVCSGLIWYLCSRTFCWLTGRVS